MQEYKIQQEKVRRPGLLARLAGLALAAALALTGCAGIPAGMLPSGGQGEAPAQGETIGTGETGDAAFQMHFIDVGQALSVLVECDGQYMLYDGGNVADGSLVVSYLDSQGVEQLEYVFCSHAHEDHVGGLAAALAYFPTNHVYAPVTQNDTACFEDFVKYTQQQGLAVEVPAVGTSWALGSATVQLLGPVKSYDDTNDTSLVLRIDYGETSFLLTGDMEQDAEDDLVASGAPLDVDVLQVGHHGSETSTGYVFLNAVLPEIVNGVDLSGTCLGYVEKDRIITGETCEEGDLIIGLKSSGIHSNGLTLARKVCEANGISMGDSVKGLQGTIGHELLTPTEIYVRQVLDITSKHTVHGLVDITGGGLRNILRMRKGLRYVIDDPIKPAAVFNVLQELGEIETREIYQTLNMSMGFTIIAPADEAEQIASENGNAQVVGRVEKGDGVLLETENVLYDHY